MKKLNIGIVGAGRIGNVHAQSITYHIPQAQILRVTDVKEDAARALAEKYGIPAYSADYMDIVNDPAIDAVLVCSPTPTHADIAIAAMKAGKHVFCEKPVDLTIEKILNGTELIVKVAGRIDTTSAPDLEKELKETLDGIIKARGANYADMTPQQKIESAQTISRMIPNIMALAEGYPELKASENFKQLSAELSQVEQDIANARKYYNGCVKNYNIACQTFPSGIIAGMFHFEKASMYEVSDTAERENVKVSFD